MHSRYVSGVWVPCAGGRAGFPSPCLSRVFSRCRCRRCPVPARDRTRSPRCRGRDAAGAGPEPQRKRRLSPAPIAARPRPPHRAPEAWQRRARLRRAPAGAEGTGGEEGQAAGPGAPGPGLAARGVCEGRAAHPGPAGAPGLGRIEPTG